MLFIPRYHSKAVLLLIFYFLFTSNAFGQTNSAYKRKVGIGINYLGLQIHWKFWREWAAEGRFLVDSAESDVGTVQSEIFGFRVQRYLLSRSNIFPYVGVEAGGGSTSLSEYSSVSAQGSFYGLFAGLEWHMTPRISCGFDIGPYQITIQKEYEGASETGIDAVANTYVNFYFW